jgi:hypothetical protein
METDASVALQELKNDSKDGFDFCYKAAKIWRPIYYGSRSSVILFSALTSAQALGAIGGLKEAQGIFALLVTLITAFDVWLKPGAKYRALYQGNDEYAELSQKISVTAANDTKGIRALQLEYRQINSRLRNVITP